MSDLKEVSSGKSEQQLEIEMLELCIVICKEHGDFERIKKIEIELNALKQVLEEEGNIEAV